MKDDRLEKQVKTVLFNYRFGPPGIYITPHLTST